MKLSKEELVLNIVTDSRSMEFAGLSTWRREQRLDFDELPDELRGHLGDRMCDGEYKSAEEYADAVVDCVKSLVLEELVEEANDDNREDKLALICAWLDEIDGYDENKLRELAVENWKDYQFDIENNPDHHPASVKSRQAA